MTSEAETCNAALAYAKSTLSLNNLDTDNSLQAKLCRAHFAICRRQVLRAVDWNFARFEVPLSLHGEAVHSHYKLRYHYPNNALALRGLVPERKGGKSPPYKLALADNGSVKTILTDKEDAIAEVTFDIKNMELFDVDSADCVSLLLSTKIVIPLGGSRALRDELERLYQLRMGISAASDANENTNDEAPLPEHLMARF